ncbi:MAG: GNAT family N-acetyltransferase [Pseudomonadota bacterium]
MNPSPRYPKSIVCEGATLDIATMQPTQADEVGAFITTLPAHDLLFLRRDVSQPKVLAAWMKALDDGGIQSLVAREFGRIVGCTAIVTDALSWSPHVGELRVLVGPGQRGRGLGRMLIQECFLLAIAMGLEKLCVQMTVDQRAAIAVFEDLGFKAEALLAGHVKDRAGQVHDLVLLSHNVQEVQSRMEAYGVAQAVDA